MTKLTKSERRKLINAGLGFSEQHYARSREITLKRNALKRKKYYQKNRVRLLVAMKQRYHANKPQNKEESSKSQNTI